MTALRITPEQAAFLRELEAVVQRAIEARNVAFSAIVRGHGLTAARLVGLEDDTLTVEAEA